MSTTTGSAVSELLGEPLVNSLILMALAALVAIPAGILLGVYAAWWRGYKRDSAITWVTLILAAMPEFVIGILLITVFATSVFKVLTVTMSPRYCRMAVPFPAHLAYVDAGPRCQSVHRSYDASNDD